MKTNKIISIAALSMALVACNDEYNDQFDFLDDSSITGTITRELTLSSADYESIASSAENIALAEQFAAADTFPSCSPTELAAIGTNHYFTTDTAAQKFIPVLLNSKYSHLGDDGSVVSVTYKKLRFTADYMQMGSKNIGSYTVSSDDYETVWGDEVKASYLTPATLKKIPALLTAAIANPQKDSIVVVNYMYDDVEPSIGGGSNEEEQTEPIYPSGSDWTFVNSGDVSLSAYAGKKVQIVFCYTSTTSVAPTWEITNLSINDSKGNNIQSYNLTEQNQFDLFTTEGSLPEGLTYVWQCDSKNGAKASAYANKVRYETKVSLCSPVINVEKGYTYNVDHACNYANGEASNYISIFVREVETSASAKTRVGSAAVSLGYNASTAYTYNGTAWEQMETDNTRLVVVDPAAYVQAGSTYFNNPKTQIPVYLKAELPYATKGDICTVIYKSTPKMYAMADYELGDETWSQNNNTEKTSTKTLKFQLTDGVWQPNGAYYSNSLLGDDGGFTEKGAVPDGLTYVWTNTNSYGWKASAYANSTKYPCTMYLVSQAISLEGAEKPALTFDEVYRYVNAPETANDILKVLVSTDYDESNSESYASCTWNELEIPVRASGEDWTFVNVGNIDLSAYKNQTIHIAFFYQCAGTDKSAATWEVKNVEVAEQ